MVSGSSFCILSKYFTNNFYIMISQPLDITLDTKIYIIFKAAIEIASNDEIEKNEEDVVEEPLTKGKASECSTFLRTLLELVSSSDKISEIFWSSQFLEINTEVSACPRLFSALQRNSPRM